jgi:hypothetical protein
MFLRHMKQERNEPTSISVSALSKRLRRKKLHIARAHVELI